MNKISIDQHNAVHAKIKTSNAGLAAEIKEFFSFEVDGAKYHPLVKAKVWNGIINLFNANTKMLPNGLVPHLEEFCRNKGYDCTVSFKNSNSVDLSDIQAYIDGLNLSNSKGEPLIAYDYQVSAVYDAIRHKRMILLSPTSSGKSVLIYCIYRWLLENNQRVMLIVPNISLIKQMASDFKDYSILNGWDVDANIHQISAGVVKEDNSKLGILSTWQSVFKMDETYFKKFDAVICDECHLSNAKSITGIMDKCTNAWYRIGLTGTIDIRGQKVKTNKLVLQGLFGFIKQVTTTKKLMDNGNVSNLKIKVLNLKYPEQFRKDFGKQDYATELNYICTNKNRNTFISKLAVSQTKNTLILTQFVDNHATPLYEQIKSMVDEDRPVYFISGSVDGDERERIRKICETDSSAIIVASIQTMSTGVSIKNLHVYIAASPSKSVVRVLQSIGRLLRTMAGKDYATLYDIADDISYDTRNNYAKLHMKERLEIYKGEQFDFKVVNVEFKN